MTRIKRIQLIIVLGLCAAVISSCAGIQGQPVAQAWLDEPLDGMEFSTSQTVTLRAHARDVNGQGIVKVQFYLNDQLFSEVATDSNLPLVNTVVEWQPEVPGNYVVKAVAVGKSSTQKSGDARVLVTGGGEVATEDHTPVISDVSGPSSIPADGQTYDFTVSFLDDDGDINNLSVSSVNGNWGDISFDPSQNIISGDVYSGTTKFGYACSLGTQSLTDDLTIILYDANGNASNAYNFRLSCEGQTKPPQTYAPIIDSIDGPSSIPADGESYRFRLSFTDGDGDVNRLVVTSDYGRWGQIDSGITLDSGGLYSGTTSFYYSCTASSSFEDTLRIKLYDAAGNASDSYPFVLGCEHQLEVPPQRFALHASLSFPGGHGSAHKIGESAQLCYTFTDATDMGGTAYNFYLYDYQPASPSSNGVDTNGPHQLLASGRTSNGTTCFDGAISGPAGLEAFRLELFNPYAESATPAEFAELWIIVQP
jgi:hypothetical protein